MFYSDKLTKAHNVLINKKLHFILYFNFSFKEVLSNLKCNFHNKLLICYPINHMY